MSDLPSDSPQRLRASTVDPAAVAALVGGYHGAPFDVLGQHPLPDAAEPAVAIRTLQPQAQAVSVLRAETRVPMRRVDAGGFFEAVFSGPARASRRSGMTEPLDLDVIWDFAIALLIGALIGVEREKRKSEEQGGIGGLRTFILLALVGAVAGFLSRGGVPWLVLAALLPVSALLC